MTRQSQLMAHCGAHRVDVDRVHNSYTPAGERLDGKRPFIPISHGVLLNLITDTVEEFGLKIVESQHALQNSGDILDALYFGLLRLEGTDGWSTMIGIRNSHDKSLMAGIVLGDFVFVCDNLAFAGEFKVFRKHTKMILDELPLLIHETMKMVRPFQEFQAERDEKYKNITLSRDQGVSLLVDLSRKHDVLPWGSVLSAVEEWDNPSFEEHAEHGFSVHRLKQSVTEVLKPQALRNQNRVHGPGRRAAAAIWNNPNSTISMHRVLDEVCGVLPFAA